MTNLANNNKNIGAALVTSLIFSFTLMVIIAALTYSMRLSKLSINTLVNDKLNVNTANSYLKNFSISQKADIDETMGKFRFLTLVDSATVGFYSKNTNGALYQAEPYMESYSLKHNLIKGGITKYTKRLIFNHLPNDIMTQYNKNTYPINIPYVSIAGMTKNLATYRLSNDKAIVDPEQGYIGVIQKDNYNLNITASGTNTTIGVPAALDKVAYNFSVGWNLKDGLWSIFLAVYDTTKIYTSSTSLRNLIDNSSQAQVELNNWKTVASLPDENTTDSSTVLTKWYYDVNNEVPKLAILRKQKSPTTAGNFLLAIYGTTYNKPTGVYTVGNASIIKETTNNIDTTKIFMVVADNAFTLDKADAKRLLVFYEDGGTTKIVQANLNTNNILTLGDLNAIMKFEPILVRKNATQMYLIYADNDSTYYIHNYRASNISSSSQSYVASDDIKKIIAKFGVLFIVTNSTIQVFDITTASVLNEIAIANGNYQILRDNDGKIYAKADSSATKHYISTGCSSGCDIIAELENVDPYLGFVYENTEYTD